MKIHEIFNLFSGRRSDIPYTSLNRKKQPMSSEEPKVEEKKTKQKESFFDEKVPSPFKELQQQLRKPEGGQLASLGLLCVAISFSRRVRRFIKSTKTQFRLSSASQQNLTHRLIQ
ncbi:unnamed protein product [Caenorhabditis sp. 36 PRJEB53466]|nr:unnamed protein product [Caenorhabditis sp. 36 PRJEB53466]